MGIVGLLFLNNRGDLISVLDYYRTESSNLFRHLDVKFESGADAFGSYCVALPFDI